MSWFDRAVARAGIDLKQREEEPVQGNDNSLVQGLLGKLGELGKGWGSNVEDVYNNSPMYADFRGVGEAWDKTDFKDPAGYYDNNTYAGSFGNAAVGNAAGVVGGVADLLGMEKLGNKMNDIVQGTHDPNEVEAGFNLDYITSPHGLARSTGNVIGSMAAIAPFTALVPEAAASTAATKLLQVAGRLGGNKGIQYLIDSGHPQLAKVFAERLGSYLPSGIAWGATSAPIESMAEGGGVVRQAKEAGLDNPYGRGWATAAENLPGLFLSNVGEGMVLRGAFKPAPGASALRRAASVPVTAGVESTQNAGEEAYQQIIQNLNTDRPLSEGVSNAALEGFFGSLLLGGAGGALHAVRNKPGETDTQEFKDWTAGAPAEQDYSNIDLSDIPMQDIEDAGLENTNAALKGKLRQLYDWTKNTFGKEFEVSGGARSPEHNREVNGSETSHHLHGNAVDIDVSMLNDEEREAFFQKAAELGFNDHGKGDDWYHDKGSGLHAHLTYVDDGGQTSGNTNGQREGHENAWAIYDVFKAAGYNDNAIAGILGRVQQEHNFDTSDVPEHEEEGTHLGGYGMFQWNGGRTTAFLNWAQENGLDPQSATTQAQYALLEAQQRGLTPEKMNQLSHEEAADLWTSDWEVGKPGDERKYAGEWLTRLQNGGGVAGGTTTSTTNTKTPQVPTVDTYDDVYEQFAREQMETSTDAEEVDYFSGFFNSKGKFKDTEENRRKLEQDYGEELKQFAEAKAAQAPTPKAHPQESKIESQTENLDKLKAKLGKFKGRAIKRKDFNTATQINKAVQTNDVPAMQNLVNQLEGTQQASSQNVPQAQPAFPIVQTPSQNAPQPAQQTEQAQPIQVPTRANEAPQTDTQQTQEELLKRLQELNRQNGNTQNVINEFDDMQRQLEERAGVQTGGNINGNTQSTQSTQTQPTQSINTANQNQNSEPGQTEAEEVNQPVQQEAPQSTSKRDNFFPYDMTYRNGKTFPVLSYHGKPTEEVNSLAQKYHGVVSPATDRYEGHISFRKGDGRTAEENRTAFLAEMNGQKANAPIEGTSAPASTPVQEAPKKESKALSKFRENVAEVIEKYRNDETTYEKAFQKIADMQVAAEHVAPDEATVQEIRQVAEDGINQLNAVFAEKQGTPSQTAQESAGEQETTAQAEEPTQEEKPAQSETELVSNEGGEKSAQNATVEENSTVANEEKLKKDYSSMSLDELKAERQKWIDEEVDRWKKNPGGQGTDNGYTYNDRGEINGRYGGSNNPDWYQWAHKRNGGKAPAKRDYPMFADEYLRNTQEYDELVNEIERREAEAKPKTEPKQENAVAEEIKGITFTFGGKVKESQYETAYTVEMDKKPSKPALDKLLEGNHHGRAHGSKAIKFNSIEAANKFLSQVEKDYGAKAIRQADKYNGFLKDMSPMAQAKTDKALSKVEEYKGKATPRGKIVEDIIANGGHADKRGNSYRIYTANDTYVDATKVEYDYAKFLENMRTTEGQTNTKTEPTKQPSEAEMSAKDDYKAKEPTQEGPAGEKEPAKEYKYYMNERGVSPGAQPKGFTRFDEEDKGGRYGAIYYDHPLTEQEIADYELTPAKESIFGDEAENEKDLLEALGITEDETEEVSFGNEFGDTTDEEIEALKKELQKELSKLSANPVFNPRIYTLGLQLGGKYIQKGYRTFKKWLDKMTSDLGEPIEPWAPAIWETLKTYPKGQKFDPKQIMAFSKLIGSKFERGVTSLEDVNADMKKLLKGRYKEFAPMIEASYNGIEKYFSTIKEGENNVNDSTRGLASRTGEGVNKDSVGRNDESGRPSRGSKREGGQKAEHDVQQQDSAGIYDSSPSRSGKAGNSGVQAEESADRSGGTRDTELSGSVRDSYEGSVALDDGRKAEDINPAEERPVNAAAEKVSKEKANTPYKAGDLDSIKADLPMLRPEQQEDVQRIEKRLFIDEGQGFLCTNGTGTGKTYSGLGVIKRAYDQGKKNILVVAPKAEIIKQWIEAAKTDFSLDIKQLSDTKDNGGKGICITTYANFQANKELAARDWDMIVADESHTLLENKDASETSALKMLRSLTEHPRQLYNRWKLKNRTKKIRALENKLDEYESKLAKLAADHNKHKVSDSVYGERSVSLKDNIKQTENAIAEEYRGMNDQWKEVEKQWKAIPSEDKPKVLFMSATPFAYDKSIDYVEGYLFNYNEDTNPGSYHNQSGFEQFMIQKFGYRFRYGKLAKPEAQVDNRVMEIQFHDDLVDAGVMYGRQIDLPVDYDRGFLLVDGGIGNKIDEGFKFLWDNNKKYGKLAEALRKQFDTRAKRYLIESIKAKAVVPIVQEYIKSGKKVVLFHQSMQEKLNVHPFQLKNFSDKKVTEQWELFKKERPDLVGLRFDDIPAPMTTLKSAFKDALYLDGSQEHKKSRNNAVKLFQDDDSGKNLIICQQDAANAGVSLHDTTGKHQRVLINIATPERPIYAMQIEGRIYRVGSVTNAIFRYLSTGTELEKYIFANTIGSRAETSENLALGADARGLQDSFTNLFLETLDDSWERRKPGHPEEGTGGKEMDFSGKSDVTLWERAKSFYYGQQKKTSSTKAQEGKDYFATPEPIGLKMVEWLGLKDGDSALEPSAGHGAISRWFSPNTNNTIVEPSGKLAPLAQMVTPNAKVIRTGFEDFNVVNKFDGIAMNPPFGQGGKTAVDHIAKAFKHLRDGGRLVAILPQGPSADAHFDKWFYGLNKKGEQVEDGVKNGVLTADISLPSVTFNRAGTGVATRIVVIDKHNNEAKQQKAWEKGGQQVDLSNIKDINELFDRMENMTVPERVKGLTAQDKAKSTNGKKYVLPAEGVKGNKTSYMAVVNDAEDVTSDDVKELAKTYRGKYIPETDSFVFDFKEERDDFIRAANDLLAKSKNPPELRDSYKGEIDGTPITIHSDGRITGKTYDIKDTIKENGGKWDRDSRIWRINDPAKLTKFINKYNTEDVQVDEQEEDTSTAFNVKESDDQYIANVKDKLEYDTYKDVLKLAKKHGGDYKKGKGFVFENEADLNEFVEVADALLGMGDAKYSITAWHGTAATGIDRLSLQYIGTGEGAQVHGYGLYFAGERKVSEGYRERLSGKNLSEENSITYHGKVYSSIDELYSFDLSDAEIQALSAMIMHNGVKEVAIKALEDAKELYPKKRQNVISEAIALIESGEVSTPTYGSLFQVEIPDEDVMLDEQKKFDEQPEKVQKALQRIVADLAGKGLDDYLSELEANHGKAIAKAAREYVMGTMDDIDVSSFDPIAVLMDSVNKPSEPSARQKLEALPDGEAIIKRLDRIDKGQNLRKIEKDTLDGLLKLNFSGGTLYDYFKPWVGSPKSVSELLNEYGIKGITYVGGRDGRCYVVFDDEAIEIIGRFSKGKEKLRNLLRSMTFPKDSELTSQEQEIVNFGKQLGVKVVWFDGNPNLHGFHQNNITFLNRRSVKDVQTTFYHETFHWLKNNNPAFYQELLASIEKAGVFTQEQLDAYREKTGRYDLSNSDAIEEMLADEFIKPASRHEVLGKLAKQNKSVVERLVAWMKRVIDRIASVFHNPQGKLTTAQRDAFVKSFNKMAASLRDQNGRAIFKTFNNGKEIMLANGVDLNTVALSKGKAVMATDKQYMDAVNKYQNATSDTERNKAFRELQDMVEDAAELAGFENAIPEQTVAYKTRTKAAPKKSIKVYKVFTVADDGSPTALFVGGTEKLPQGVWLDAMDTYHFQAENGSYYVPSTKNPNSKGGATGTQVKIPNEQVLQDLKERGYANSKAKVGTSITALAYRPGWHAGTLPFFPQGGTKIKNPDYINAAETPDVAQFADTPYPNVHRYNQVVFECELAFDKDYNEAAQATKDGDLEYLPEDGSYYFATNPLTRANPELGAWVISGSLKIGRALTKEECDTILEEHDMAPQQWEGGQLRKGTEAERQAAIDNYFEEEYAKVDENGKHKKKQFENREVYQKWYDKQMEAYPGKLAEWEKKVAAWEASGKKGNKPSKPSRPKAIDAMASGYGYISGDLDLAALGYTGPQHDAARKTLAPITYDDNGEVIPLSERFNPNIDDIRFSADIGDSEKSFLDKLAGKFGRKVDSRIQTAQTEAPKGIGLFSYYLGSPSRIAEKVKSFKPFYTMADKAMNLITKNRTDFMRKYEKAWELCKKQEEKDKLSEILLLGDSEGKEFTREEILAEGGSENVAKAYETLRRLTRKAYNLVNEARKKPKPHSRRLTDDEIAKLEENKFIQIQKITPTEDGRKLVTYKEFANWQKEYDVTPEELARLQADDAIQILESHENEDGTTHVKVREGIGDLTNRKGYIPHIFHEYMVRVKDKDGNVVEDYGYGGVLTSGRNEKEAVAKAEEWLKNNKLKDGETIYVAPKVFNFNTLGMSEKDYGVIMGDKDYDTMMESIADNNEMTLKEVKDMLGGSVRKKNRHRFFGHVLKRQGAKGYEEDMQWALRHYFNSAIRYHAMETEFKPQAISLFERLFGDFDKKHTGIAAYTQDFINDINGNPTQLELWINDTLNRIPAWRKFVVASYGDRAALKAANSVTNLMSHLCLGYLNVSSALLNFSQAINAAAYLGNAKYAPMVIARGSRRFSPKDLKVLIETNVGNDIGLDSGSGYDKARSVGGVLSTIGNKGMILFKKSEQTMRFGTTLVAYDKARAEGKTHDEAIKYAREINRKSNFDYSVADAPNIFRRGSIISQICLQFKKYGFKEMEVVGDMLPGNTKTSKAQKAIFWGMYLLTAGLLQVPLWDWWDKLIGESLYGGKESVQKAIMEAAGDSPLGQVLAKTAMYGIVSNIGIDMSKRTGLADVVPTKWSDLAGPAPSKIFSFINDVAAGNKANAIRDVSPGIYNQYAAWIAGHSESGRNRTTATYDDTYSKILRSMGFSSTDERMASDIQQIMYKEREKLKAQKQKAIDEFIADPSNENAKKLKELGVKPSTVKKERARKKADRLNRMRVDMSKKDQKQYKKMFDFAEDEED